MRLKEEEIVIKLAPDEYRRLTRWAARENRDADRQATYILRRLLVVPSAWIDRFLREAEGLTPPVYATKERT